MNASAAIMGSFVCACAIITVRDIKNPDADWPLPAPPPYRYIGAGVAFGLLGLVGSFFNEKLAAVLAIGLVVGLGFQTAQSSVSSAGGGLWNNILKDIKPGGTALGTEQSGSSEGSPIKKVDKA